MSELHYCTAVELVGLIRTQQVSTMEVMDAHLERISQVNHTLNAIVTLVTDTVQVICLMSAVNLFAMAMYASLYTYTPEVFPTAVRTSGNGLVAAASRVAATAMNRPL